MPPGCPKPMPSPLGWAPAGRRRGLALKQLARVFPLDSSYSLVMPSNYILAEDVEGDSQIRQKLADASWRMDRMAEEIKARKKVYQVKEGPAAWLKSSLIHTGFDRFARNTRPFHADDRCNGCGQCARDCPAGTITPPTASRCGGKSAASACGASTPAPGRPSSTARAPKSGAATPSKNIWSDTKSLSRTTCAYG